VTGAGGFVGGHLRSALEQRGYDVVSLFSPLHATAEQLAVDLADPEATARVVADAQPDALVHLAARARPAGLESMQALLDNNVRAAHNVLEAVRCLAPRARAIIVTSSAVYGAVPRERNPVLEEEPLRPLLPYGASKAAVEVVTSVYAAHGLDVVTVRPFNLLGPGQGAEFVAGRFAQEIVQIASGRAEPAIETGPLEPVRDFTDVRDAVRAYVALLEHRTGPGPFNVCSGIPRSVGDMLREMVALASVHAAIRQRPGAGTPPGLDVAYQCGSRAAIGKAVGWEPEIPWRETLRDMLADWGQRVRTEAQ
jgi:GDP-4-dehydro-6-deoxy-D-mannose reductase